MNDFKKANCQEIAKTIGDANNILLITHYNPDGDAIGSIGAVSKYLKKIDKNYSIFFDGKFSDYGILPNIYSTYNKAEDIFWSDIDLIIVLDAGNLKHCHLSLKKIRQNFNGTIINIDHHISNIFFGNINLVDEKASSTCQIIAYYFNTINFNINKVIADCLLLGLVTDTQNFSNAATNAACLYLAADLLYYGADWRRIISVENKKIHDLKLWGDILDNIHHNRVFNIAYIIVNREIRKSFLNQSSLENLSNIFNAVDNISFALVIKEHEDDVLKVSLRTNDNTINLSRLAKFLGGGGHKKAAGFTVCGKLQQNENGWKVV